MGTNGRDPAEAPAQRRPAGAAADAPPIAATCGSGGVCSQMPLSFNE
jgi:hypothetical protein